MKKPSLGTARINNPSAPVVGLGQTLGDSLEDCGPTGLEYAAENRSACWFYHNYCGWVDVYDACVSAGSCVSLHTCKGQMTTVRSWFFPSTMGSGD